ncbi:sensor histidine kinase [Natronospirillum operosum]|nr:HAMP domain-containing sensor histidine kinase [Natronospirillum operosum]
MTRPFWLWPGALNSRDGLLLVLLGMAAFVGNYFPLPLMFGVDLLLGTVFVFFLLLRYRLLVALLVSLPAFAATWMIWHHPWTAFLMVVELVLLGALLARFPRREPPLLVALLWVPWLTAITLLYYYFQMRLPWPDATLLAFKQGINSIIAMALAVMLNIALPRTDRRGNRARLGAHEVIYYLPSMLAALIMVIVLVVLSQTQMNNLRQDFEDRLVQSRDTLVDQTRVALQQLEQDMEHIESQCFSADRPPDSSAGCVQILLPFSLWDQVYVLTRGDIWQMFDRTGMALRPMTDLGDRLDKLHQRADLTAGFRLNGSDLHYFVPHSESPDVWVGGAVRLTEYAAQIWFTGRDGAQRQTWYHEGAPVVTSGQALSTWLQEDDYQRVADAVEVVHLVPERPWSNKLQRWAESVYVLEADLADLGLSLPGRVRFELNPRQEQLYLYRLYALILGIALAFLLLVQLISLVIARWLVSPVTRLMNIAQEVPQRISQAPANWPWPPPPPVREIETLQQSLRAMSELLHEQYLRDQDRQSELEQEVAAARAQVKAQEEVLAHQARRAAMGEMVSNIAHQWRQPLNSLRLLQTNLREAYEGGELTPEMLYQNLDKSEQLIQNMNQTVRDFLTFFRPDKAAEPFRLRPVVQDAMQIMRGTLDDCPLELTAVLESDVQVKGYPNELIQVLLVLMQNSREIIEHRQVVPGHIDLHLTADEQFGRVMVTDNGGGVPVDILDHLFDPYFTTRSDGTGIGLYMARSIVEGQMQGHIRVENLGPPERPDGARFTISLPLWQPPEQPHRTG